MLKKGWKYSVRQWKRLWESINSSDPAEVIRVMLMGGLLILMFVLMGWWFALKYLAWFALFVLVIQLPLDFDDYH